MLFFTLFLVICNLACFWKPAVAALLLFEVLLVQTTKGKYLMEALGQLILPFFAISIILVALTFLLVLTISPERQSGPAPIVGTSVNYNMNFAYVWLGADVEPSLKVLFAIVFESNFFCVMLALGVFYFLQVWTHSKRKSNQCELCSWHAPLDQE